MLLLYFTFGCGCRNIRHTRKFSSDTSCINRQILSDLLGVSSREASLYINKHKLHHKEGELLAKSIQLCQSLGYENMDILTTPNLLTVHPLELEQHYKALQEGGFSSITPHVLSKARTYMRRIIVYLKSKNLIPYTTNVPETLVSYIEDKEIAKNMLINQGDEILWNKIHLELLKNYLRLRLNGTEGEIENLFRIHRFVKNKSFKIIQENIKIAESLGFEPKKIIKYGYLLANWPNYTETTLRDLGNIAGINMRQAMRRYPKLVMTPPRNIIKVYGILKEFEIPDESIRCKPNVLHMAPETVKLRLQEIEKNPDMKILLTHPKIVSLVVHHNRAKTRLSFLQQSQLRCAPLTILKTDLADVFEEYVKEGKDINKKSDLLHFLETLFSVKRNELRQKIRRHPYYLQVPLKDIQETYDYLIANRFTVNNIYNVIYILLYPKSKVKCMHEKIKYDNKYKYKSLSQVNKLNLMLYFMEKEHHFTGNGIWKNYQLLEQEKNSQ